MMKMQSLIACASLVAALSCAPAPAAENLARSVERGQAHYLLFCANCHGVNADGKGPLVELLKVTPSDLRTLSKTGAGQSVTDRVLKAVDGRHQVSAGERKMPVFSDNLEIGTIIEIGAYLESIQKP